MKRRYRGMALSAAVLVATTPWALADAGYRIEGVAEGLEHPWSLAFLPDGEMLVTERPGRLRLIDAQGQLREEPVAGVPSVFVGAQAGLFEVLLAPDFADSGYLYLSYAYGDIGANNTCLGRARFNGDRLMGGEVLFCAAPAKRGAAHYGGRLALLPDETLILTLGDGFDYREEAQQPSNHLGSLVRLALDGRVPHDNPFLDDERARPELYSIGHRNVQGIVFDGERGELLINEHGPRGGDELNRIEPGANYGWPLATHGVDYTGARISPFDELPEFVSPLLHWTPSIAPSGMALYDGDAFPDWRGDLFVSALAGKQVRRLIREQGEVVDQEALFEELDARIRDVRMGPDGYLYLLTDEENGELLRVVPTD